MKLLLKFLRVLLFVLFALFTLGVAAFALTYVVIAPQMPSIENLREIRLQVPLRIYTQDRKLLAEFGEKRRNPVDYKEIPEPMVHAFLAAEDDRFFDHPGVDYQGLLRAAIELARTGQKRQGGSTITMQVARNMFLTREKSYTRKLTEIFLALKIEQELSKQEIFALYANKIYLGHRAYGVAAAAQVYYGKSLADLTIPEIAMIAGLPKAPSRFNPVTNPKRALERRDYVLARMRDLGYLSPPDYRVAVDTPDDATIHATPVDLEGRYIAEMVRSKVYEQYGEQAYAEGFDVTTTVDSSRQIAAVKALRDGLIAYDRRHGYRGAETHHDLAPDATRETLLALLKDLPPLGGLQAALVTDVNKKTINVLKRDGEEIGIEWDGLSWARAYKSPNYRGVKPKTAGKIVKRGDVIRIRQNKDGKWQLAALPAVEGALVSVMPKNGAIVALVGGFDFNRSKFNRATQAKRQPGSNFKPFLYSAALEKGFTTASIINDAPVVFDDPALENTWRPENYSGKFFGPTRLREALVNSRNLVSVRLLRAIGIPYAVEYASRFGFPQSALPRDLSLALGSGTITPLELVTGYAALANGGFRIEPYLIQSIVDRDGNEVYNADPRVAGHPCRAPTSVEAQVSVESCPETAAERIIPAQNDYLMYSMMRDVIRRGTGKRALVLKRKDLAGKTGTTNDQQDAWFSGFNTTVATTTWVGFDQVAPLGRGETGGKAALPIWVDYMREALRDQPEAPVPEPPGIVTVRIDPKTGEPANAFTRGAIFEIFRENHIPETPVLIDNDTGIPSIPEAPSGEPEQPLF